MRICIRMPSTPSRTSCVTRYHAIGYDVLNKGADRSMKGTFNGLGLNLGTLPNQDDMASTAF